MITFERVGVTYAGAVAPVLSAVDLEVPEGELCLVIGGTGVGKSTLLGLVNGLVPHFTGGTVTGDVRVAGRNTREYRPRDLADVVGVVSQDPRATFVTDTVADELAYTMESLALPGDVMRRRVEDTIDLLGLAEIRHRSLSSLSGGQAQRVAIGAVLTAGPRVLVLDEPTSALDPAAAEEVLAVLQRLVHDVGLTVLLAEHRLERVVQYADSVVWLPGHDVAPRHGSPAEILAAAPFSPPAVALGKRQGWTPLPLSVRDARRAAVTLRERLPGEPPAAPAPVQGATVGAAEKLSVRYGDLAALDEVDLTFHAGEVVALMGRNGAGKSTLFGALAGLIRPAHGRARLAGGVDPRRLKGPELVRHLGLVPQQPADLLYGETVAGELRASDRDAHLEAGTSAAVLDRLVGDAPLPADRHPRDLSEGQRLMLALAVVLAAAPPLLLLDEPTRGLDYPAKARLITVLRDLAARGHGVVLATHDVELAGEVSDRTVVLADGAVVADGPSREVVTHTPVFSPQIAKVLSPLPYLTLSDVVAGLAVVGAS